jgi:spore maturation protein CgeB
MNILLVGYDRPGALERSYARALSSLGVDNEIFEWFEAGAIPFGAPFNRRPAWPIIARRANARLRDHCSRFGYDAIVVFKGLLIDRLTVERIQASGRPAVCIFPDNPWNRAVTSYSEVSHNAMPAWDAYVIWSEFLVDRLYCAGCRRVEVLPFAWDPQAHPYAMIEPAEEANSIVFVGSWSRHREMWLSHLSDYRVTLFGPAWADAARRLGADQFHIEPQVPYEKEYADTTRRARVALNLLDPHNCPGSNMRSFEIPGIGGVTCSTYTPDLAGYFPDDAICTFRTPRELRSEIDRLLSDPMRRAEIRQRSHAIAKRHTYQERARDLVALIEELQGTSRR